MEIISHRGYWTASEEKNTETAFRRSFDLGLGTETDVRDCGGKLVISHDPPLGGEITLSGLLEIMGGRNLTLALNIKADGITQKAAQLMDKHGHTNYFMFDMSIPDYVFGTKLGLRLYTGCSEYVKTPVLLGKAEGLWLDMFESQWYTMDTIDNFLRQSKKVCLVSPDLHKRNHMPFWEELKKNPICQNKGLLLCTDYPREALEFFK